MPSFEELFTNWRSYKLDDGIYALVGAKLEIGTEVELVPFERSRPSRIGGREY